MNALKGGGIVITDRSSSMFEARMPSTNELRYITRDHLGSLDAITTASGTRLTNLSHGAFGQRRDAADWVGAPSSADEAQIEIGSRRGFTFHEMLDNLNLTHMNGRVYDQLSARFISPDPFIDGAMNTQGWNRYAYVKNNPLSFIDPSGFKSKRCGDVADKCKVEESLFIESVLRAIDERWWNESILVALNRLGTAIRWAPPGTLSWHRAKEIAPVSVPGVFVDAGSTVSRMSLDEYAAHTDRHIAELEASLEMGDGTVPYISPYTTADGARDLLAVASVIPAIRSARFLGLGRGALALGGFARGVTTAEVAALNRAAGGAVTLTGSIEGVLAQASRYDGFYNESAAVIRGIAHDHLFDNGNKRTAHAVYNLLRARNGIATGVSEAQVRRIINDVATGKLREIDDIARALRGF